MSIYPRVLVIDAGLGNLGSVEAAFERLQCHVVRLSSPPNEQETLQFTHTVLPGVGAFAAGVSALRINGWDTWIRQSWVPLHRPLLGICLGMQLLATTGSEGQSSSDEPLLGLDLIPGNVQILSSANKVTLPHVGWNSLSFELCDHQLINGLTNGGDMYFVHSYAFKPSDPRNILAVTSHGEKFASMVFSDLCFGVQFHPEKSQKLGKQLLHNFLSIMSC